MPGADALHLRLDLAVLGAPGWLVDVPVGDEIDRRAFGWETTGVWVLLLDGVAHVLHVGRREIRAYGSEDLVWKVGWVGEDLLVLHDFWHLLAVWKDGTAVDEKAPWGEVNEVVRVDGDLAQLSIQWAGNEERIEMRLRKK